MIVSEKPRIELINGDCMPALKAMEDNQFDLAIVDPEYRDKNQPTQQMRKKGNMKNWSGMASLKFFSELSRCSFNQIIWGGNYYANILDVNNNWIVWYKNNDGTGFSMCELAWTSIKKNIKLINIRSPQTLQREGISIHPTQKPIKLYKWLLKNYAKPGDTILDTHGGSMSIAIACYDMGFDLTCYELDKDYYKAAVERFQKHIAQKDLFQENNINTYGKQMEI